MSGKSYSNWKWWICGENGEKIHIKVFDKTQNRILSIVPLDPSLTNLPWKLSKLIEDIQTYRVDKGKCVCAE